MEIETTLQKVDASLGDMLASCVMIGVGLLFFVGAKKLGTPKEEDIHKDTIFKKLDIRYEGLEKNLEEINHQMWDNQCTYIVRPGLYITNDWLLCLDLHRLEFVQQKDIVNAFVDTAEQYNPAARTTMHVYKLVVLLDIREVVAFPCDRAPVEEVIHMLKQKNPYLLVEKPWNY